MGTPSPEPGSIQPVDIIGMGMSPNDLTADHLRLIEEAALLVGGRRHLALFKCKNRECIEITSDLKGLAEELRRQSQSKRIVVLASGDPLYYGVGAYLVKALGREKVRVHPNITSVAAAFARMGEPWQDVCVVSLHGRRQEGIHKAPHGNAVNHIGRGQYGQGQDKPSQDESFHGDFSPPLIFHPPRRIQLITGWFRTSSPAFHD